jgi:hypothetical protein
MTPSDIQKYFKPVFEQANALKEAFERRAQNEQQAATSQVSKFPHTVHENLVALPSATTCTNPILKGQLLL